MMRSAPDPQTVGAARFPSAPLPPRAGAGLKPEHVDQILSDECKIGFLEVHAENYMGDGGPPHRALTAIRRDGNNLVATIGSDYSGRTEEREIDQVVIEHGTLPLDDLYFALKPLSRNLGEVDYPALIAGREQAVVRNEAGQFRLFRIGDAVAARNIHAAIYDALRLCMAL